MDEQLIKAALGPGAIVIAKGVAKFYRGDRGRWVEGKVGMFVWQTAADGIQWFKLLRLSDGEVLEEEELYENFVLNYKTEKTQNGTNQFHIMEFEDYVAGVCFAKEADANEFKSKIPIMAPQPRAATNSKEAKRAQKEAEKYQKEKEAREKAEAKEREKQQKREEKERKKREKAQAKKGGGGDAHEMVIGAPTNFQHITHVGWDEAKGFQVRATARRGGCGGGGGAVRPTGPACARQGPLLPSPVTCTCA
jgi:flagellar biosynthesis GTPase FlhF